MEPVQDEPVAVEESPPPVAADQPQQQRAAQHEQETTFTITEFKVEGNTIFTSERLLLLLDDFIGPRKTAGDVEKARETLEKFYHDEGYPSVIANIPEQKVEEGIVRLQLIESKISATRLTGNRHFSTAQIMDKLPSLAPGTVIYAPDVEKEIGRVNRNQDLKVVPSAMTPGKDLGTIEVDLKAEDHLPFHGSIEVSNRSAHDTTPLRINMGAHYDNLWGLEHSLSLQYQFSPQKFNEVEVVSASYMLPAPWYRDSNIVVYGVYSNSNTRFGDSFNTLGKGDVIGVRYVFSFTPYKSFTSTAILGFDYKNFDESTSQGTSQAVTSPVEYMPLSLVYSGSLLDSTGTTLFNVGFNMAFRGLIAREQAFDDKRFKARSNYFYAALGVERRQKLPYGAGLNVKLDGQIADQPLISNEQYAAGGMDNVRGYKDSEIMGDSAFHGMIELVSPNLAPNVGLSERFLITPYIFYDFAVVMVKDPLPGQDNVMDLEGGGFGIRGALFKDLEFQADCALALTDTQKIKKWDNRIYFKVKYLF
ncbi:MAG TPA: ShlB/FhaC/HecB family hemolysin secretion/activation protein [Geobacteraceae bacterium]